jgi:tetratricopeptide (TPR) repeat protein
MSFLIVCSCNSSQSNISHYIMQKITLYLCLIGTILTVKTFGQSKNLKEEAAYYFDVKDYKKSYDLYNQLYTQSPKNLDYKFRLGYSAIRYPEKKIRSIEIFEELKKVDKDVDMNYYLGKAYHINQRFDDAINLYNVYLTAKGSKIKEDDKLLVEDAKLGILNCNNGKELIAKKIIANIKNIGSPLNTGEDEYVPVISADESVLIYTYVGKHVTGGKVNDDMKSDKEEGYYHEDIYIAKRIADTTFSEGTSISNSINTKGHDAAIALSPDGTTLFTYKSTEIDNGDIYTSTLSGDVWSEPVKLNSNINTGEWEGSCSISSDGRYLYFASERAGGMGGKDLYVSEKVDGDWGVAKNLGDKINTIYNDDAPFIHPDGITLFFSSEGHKSIGGYDIMYSVKQENNWIEPISMGMPLNTTEDDRYYVINAKGETGYFSSNRGETGGKGRQDIYTVTPGILGEKPVLALLKGSVFADDKPTEAKIEVSKKETNEAIGPYYANSKTGKYLMALAPGSGYKIKITVSIPGYEPMDEEIDIEKLHKFVEIKKDFYVYSPTYENKRTQKTVKSILDSLLGEGYTNAEFLNQNINDVEAISSNSPQATIIKEDSLSNTSESKTAASSVKEKEVSKSSGVSDEPVTIGTTTPLLKPCEGVTIPDFTNLKGKSLNVIANYQQLLKVAGDVCAEGMVFKIQIGAYRNPQNFKSNHLKEFGEPEVINYPDGISRFTQLAFSTLKEAEVARQKIKSKGQNDAWITAFVSGKRYTLEELILVDFLAKAVN